MYNLESFSVYLRSSPSLAPLSPTFFCVFPTVSLYQSHFRLLSRSTSFLFHWANHFCFGGACAGVQLKRFSLARLSKSLGRSPVELASAQFGVLKVKALRARPCRSPL
jgi:hypothetical protein